VFVCPSLGYYEFLDLAYLDQILAWQQKSGCYGRMPRPRKGPGVDRPIEALAGKFEDDYVESNEAYPHMDELEAGQPVQQGGRRLLVERKMSGMGSRRRGIGASICATVMDS